MWSFYRIFAYATVFWVSCYSPLTLAHQNSRSNSDQSIFHETVLFGDLDLSSSNDQNELRSRVQFAAKRLCKRLQGTTLPLYGGIQARKCYDKTVLDAEPQVALVISYANRDPALEVGARSIVIVTSPVR